MPILNPGFELPKVPDALQIQPRNWTGQGNVWVIRSGSSAFGGIHSSEGNQLAGLGSRGASIQQAVQLISGTTYALTFSAATSSEFGSASLTVSVGDAVLVVDKPLQSVTMATYLMRFVADATSKTTNFSAACGYGCVITVFLDSISLQKGNAKLLYIHVLS